MKQKIMVDFESCVYNLQLESEEDIIDMLVFHLNLAFVHSQIDKNMFFGECKKEGWDPKLTWNEGFILGQGLGDWGGHKFAELFPQSTKFHEKGRIMKELNPYTGRHKIPTHYHKKK